MKHPARVFMVSLLVGLAASGCGREAREARQKKAPTDYQLALEKINDRLYDARKHGLESLSFEMRFTPAVLGSGEPGIRSAIVHWQSAERFNILPMDSEGRPIQVHPLLIALVEMDYIRPSLPFGADFRTGGYESGSVQRTQAGRSIVVRRPIYVDGKLVTKRRLVYECDNDFALRISKEYGMTGAGAPPPDQPYKTSKYRVLDNGHSVRTEVNSHRGHSLGVEYEKMGKFWLPAQFSRVENHGSGRRACKVTFTNYKINPRLPKSAFVPPEWPRAKLDLSSPERTLRSLYDALYLGDLDGIGRCLSKESRSKWKDDLAEVRRQYDVPGKRPPGFEHWNWRTWWSGFIHCNAGKTSKLVISEEKRTDRTFTAHLKTVTTGRPVDLQVKLVKERRAWKVANTPDEILKGYD